MNILTRLNRLEKRVGDIHHRGMSKVYSFERGRIVYLYSYPNGKDKDDKSLILIGNGFIPPNINIPEEDNPEIIG